MAQNNRNRFLTFTFLFAVLAFNSSCDDSATPQNNTNLSKASSQRFFLDADGDGFGDPSKFVEASSAPQGYVADNTDCDDKHYYVNPKSKISENKSPSLDFNCDGIFYQLPRKKVVHDYSGNSYAVESSWDEPSRKLVVKYHQNDSFTSSIINSMEFAYDAKGNLLTEFSHDNGDVNMPVTSSIESIYDANGNMIYRKDHGNGDLNTTPTVSVEMTYDANGNLLTEKSHDGTLSDNIQTSREMTYDTKGNQLTIKTRIGNLDNPPDRIQENSFDVYGNIVSSKIQQDLTSTPSTQLKETTYDSNGAILISKVREGGMVTQSVESVNDDHGNHLNQKKHSTGDLDSPVDNTSESTYDSYGNRIKSVQTQSGNTATMTVDITPEDVIPIKQPLKVFMMKN